MKQLVARCILIAAGIWLGYGLIWIFLNVPIAAMIILAYAVIIWAVTNA